MSEVQFFVFAALLISACLYTVVSSGTDEKSHCEKWGIQIAEGKTVSVPGQCMQATCTKALKNEISSLECPVFKLRAECHVVKEDLSKSYPDCCPQPICPESVQP